jgi:peptide/nickel transport system ATP-binding protein
MPDLATAVIEEIAIDAEPEPAFKKPVGLAEPRIALEVSDLSVGPRRGRIELDRVSLKVMPGETVVLFGERGCGKEVLVRAVGGALTRQETMTGTLRLGNGDAAIRLAYLPGPYMKPLSPHASVVAQLSRVIMRKLNVPESAAREELRLALARLDGAPSFETLADVPTKLAPHDLSFALLAAATAQTPELVLAEHFVADIALIPARRLITALLSEQKRLGFALLYSARGAHVLNWLGGRVLVMRSGRIVEEGSAERLASGAAHAYTQTLFRGLPRLSLEASPRTTPRGEPMLQVRGLELGQTGKSERALSREGLTFELRRGAAIALVGEEGSGRRRLARTLIGLERPGAGRIVLDSVDIGILNEGMLQRMRRRVAFIVGTDDVLDDRMTLWDTVAEPLRAHLNATRDVIATQAEGALKRVGLAGRSTTVAELTPFDRRRLQIARAIVTQPHIAIIDEPLRGLDAFGQGVIRDLLKEFRRQEGPAFLVVTADFSIADAFAEEAFVFEKGRVIERGSLAQLLRNPKEAETKRLIDAVTAAALPKSPGSV